MPDLKRIHVGSGHDCRDDIAPEDPLQIWNLKLSTNTNYFMRSFNEK